MKRLREETEANPQWKPPLNSSSPGELAGPSNPLTSNNEGSGGDQGAAQNLTLNDCVCYLRQVKETFHGQKDKYERFLEVMLDFKNQRITKSELTQRVKELFNGHPSLIRGFSLFLPMGAHVDEDGTPEPEKHLPRHHMDVEPNVEREVDDFWGSSNLATYKDNDALKRTHRHEFAFLEKVKERLQSADQYQSFLKCLHMYITEIVTREQLQSLTADLLGKYPDLMEGFNEFLERCERTDGFLSGVIAEQTLLNEANCERWGMSSKDLDLLNCERCTPSYRFLPVDYPMHTASQRSELDDEVLNDRWVSVASGSFNHKRQNPYEESLFKCEDDRFELDMLIESCRSTAQRVEELLSNNNLNNSLAPDGPIRIDDHFTALDVRCIDRLYSGHGLDVMGIVRRNPSLALPVVLNRLKQKEEEWTSSGSQFGYVWVDAYARNHCRSLDQRSFVSKLQDSK